LVGHSASQISRNKNEAENAGNAPQPFSAQLSSPIAELQMQFAAVSGLNIRHPMANDSGLSA